MGIKDINPSLKKEIPEAFDSIPLSNLSGKAIGIDTSLWMFKSKSSAMKDVLRTMKDPLQKLDEEALINSIINQFYGFMYKLCSSGITPVWIFDGTTHPAKIATDKRKKVKCAKKICINDERERLLAMDPLSRKAELDNFTKSLLSCFSFTKNEEDALKNEIQSLGVPMFVAPHDAEIFASALSKRKLLAGVWTTDTDTYAAGSLMTISSFSKGYSSEGIKIDVVFTSKILDHFKITCDQFTDYCILHECDFNQRIPGLGPVGILKKMRQYKWDLDEFVKAESTKPWDMINLDECRNIFKGPDVSNISIIDLCIDRSKWVNHMKNKKFDIEIPDDPKEI